MRQADLSARIVSRLLRYLGARPPWMAPDLQRAFQSRGLNVGFNNYYSVFPDIATLPDLWSSAAFSRAWDEVVVDDYGPLLDDILRYASELKEIPRFAASGFYWDNPMFPPLDAMSYYGVIRSRRPARIIEVGSGFSTLMALRAIEKNGHGGISCVEPYPSEALVSNEGRLRGLDRRKGQELPTERFAELKAGDVLFIDTSHAVKAGSDVNYLLFNVLPTLRSGVLVHIHDIFLPHEYPEAWFKDVGIVWNEQYAVLALLMSSSRLRAVLPVYHASVEHADRLHSVLGDFDIWELKQNLGGARGASLWLRVA